MPPVSGSDILLQWSTAPAGLLLNSSAIQFFTCSVYLLYFVLTFSLSLSPLLSCCCHDYMFLDDRNGALESSLAYSQSFCPTPCHLFLEPQGVEVIVDELLVPVSSKQTYLSTDTRSATNSFWDWMSPFFGSTHHSPLSSTFCHIWICKPDVFILKAVRLRWGNCISQKERQSLKDSQWEKKIWGKEKEIGTVTKMVNKSHTHTHACTHTDERQTWQWFLSFPSCCSLPTPETLPRLVIAMLVLACVSRWCWPAISLGRWAKWSDYSNDRCTHLSNSSACLPAHSETAFM